MTFDTQRAERRAAMGHEEAHFVDLCRARIPAGDRPTHPSDEGLTCQR